MKVKGSAKGIPTEESIRAQNAFRKNVLKDKLLFIPAGFFYKGL